MTINDSWLLAFVLIFAGIMIYFLLKFLGVFFQFVQAKGCLTVGLLAVVGLPGIFILSMVTGSSWMSALLILLSAVGVITGYIARDSEGNVGKFGLFIMIVSIITLILAVFFTQILSHL